MDTAWPQLLHRIDQLDLFEGQGSQDKGKDREKGVNVVRSLPTCHTASYTG